MIKQSSNHRTIPLIIRNITVLYPISILALILFPLLVGSFINYHWIDTRQIGILLVWIPLFTIPFLLFRKRIFYYLVTILCFINGFITLGSWILVKHPVTSSAMYVLFNTNHEEALGFIYTKSGYEYFLIIPYLILFFLALRYPPKIKYPHNKLTYYIAGITALIFVLFITENTVHKRLIRKGMPSIVKAAISYNKELKAYRNLKTNKNIQLHNVSASVLSIDKPEVVVLIMGESTNRNHMSVYGYSRKTNPLLSKFENLIVYNNVISGYTHTLESVPTSLSAADLLNKEDPPRSITLAEIFNTAGFRTYWLSNQSPIGVWDNLVTLFAQQYDEVRFVNGSGNSSIDVLNSRSYDQKLFEPLSNALAKNVKRKFIVIHLMGAHTEYDLRYPPKFNYFKDNSSKKNRMIATYDNAILYNDFVVDSLLKTIRDYCQKNDVIGSALYVSDHGENVYTTGDYVGHDHGKIIPNCLVEIPFMIWLSPEYKQTYPHKSKLIWEHRSLPFVTDDLFHALIDLTSVKTPAFMPQRSVFNKKFNRNQKRVLVNGHDYDKKQRRKLKD